MNKSIYNFILSFAFIVIIGLSYLPINANAEAIIPLNKSLLTSSSSNNDIYFNKWSNSGFENTDGKLVSTGLGFNPYYSSTSQMYAHFNIKDYEHSTFETSISLDKKWIVGDRGKTQVVIYADDNKVYDTQFNNLTTTKDLKVAIPKNTTTLKLYVIMAKGSQGNHSLIFDNPRLTDSLPLQNEMNSLSLLSIGTNSVSSGNDFFVGKWSSTPFENAEGRIYGRGIGFEPYYSSTSRIYAKYYVKDYNFTTLETEISTDNKWRAGDLGKSEALIYADDAKLYSYTFTNSSSPQKIKLQIPANTKEITFYVLLEKGFQGNHGVIFENPLLTNELPQASAVDIVSVIKNGASQTSSSSDVYTNRWDSLPFQMSEGYLIAKGIGLEPYYLSTQSMNAKYYIGDYDYATLKTKVSLDNKWKTGDRGSSIASIYADGNLLYQKTFTNLSETDDIILTIPQGTQYLNFVGNIIRGSIGNHGVIFEDPILTNLPIEVESIIMKIENKSLQVGDQYKFVASISPENATNKNIQWSVTNPSVAMIDQDGNVNAINPGTTTIIATSESSGVKTFATLTVTAKDIKPDPISEYKEWKAKFEQPVDKEWSITFSLPVDRKTITPKNIFITNSQGNEIEVSYTIENNVIIISTLNSYTNGETYTLFIKNLIGKNGEVLQENIKMDFTIKKD